MITPSDLHHRAGLASGGAAVPSREEAYVSPSRLARFWAVHTNTVYRDIRKGALQAFRLPGGQLRVKWIDAERYGRPIE